MMRHSAMVNPVSPDSWGPGFDTKEMAMKLVYDVVEDVYDDTTQIRTMTEQAKMPSGDWLIRTTVYTPHHISMDVTHVRPKQKRKSLFKSLR